MRETMSVLLAIGLIFAPLGAVMAGLITYTEYSQHRLPKGRAIREALISACFAFLILLLLTLAAGWAMG